MADLPNFQFTTQEDWYWEIPFFNGDATGLPLALTDANGNPRVFEVPVTPSTQGVTLVSPVITLSMGAGNGILIKSGTTNTLVFRVPKAAAAAFPRGEFTADILEVVDGERHLFMPVRVRYGEPSTILAFLSRAIGVTFAASRQPIVTPVAIAGRQGARGPGVLNGTRAPLKTDGIDGDFWIFDRTSSSQGRLMYGPKAGDWPSPAWNIQVASYQDVPGLSDALAGKLDRSLLVLDHNPTADDIPAGTIRAHKNSVTGKRSIWVNDGGTLIDLINGQEF